MDMNEKKAENTPAGGVLVGKKDGQTIIHDEGTMSGYLVGKLHKDGGIKAVNKATGQPLEMQGGEVVITAPAVADTTKREFEGKMMTNREILSAINQKGGGVSFAEGGEVPERFTPSGASYNYGGKTMTDHEILKVMNGSGHLSKGKSLKQIAEMHNVSLSHINEELAKGLEVEKEHFSDFKERARVAKDHLVENPNYYTILAKAGLKRGGKLEKEDLVKDAKSGNTPARDLNNYNDVLDLEADGMVGADSGLAFANGGQVSNFFKKTYGNLVEKQGIITTKTDWFNKDGVKVLQYGFDPYRNEESNTLFYYSWDFQDSGMDYDDFRNQLVDFFKKTYKKDVSELKALYVGWDRKEKDTYANGGITPYDANLDGDSVDVIEDEFAKGGVVYDTTKPKIEKVTIKETRFNRASVVGRNASTVSELQQIVSDYIGTSPKEDYDWIKFYVNDGTKGGYYIDLNKGKKNTVRNVNPETLNSINFKRVIDAKTTLVRNYDWTDFFEGATNKTVRKGKTVDGVNVVYFDTDGKSKIFQYVGNSIQLYNFLRKLYNDGGRYAELQPSGNGILEYPKSIDINSRAWQNALFREPEKQAIESIMNSLAFVLFPKLDFSKFNNRYTPTASTSTKPFDLTNTKIWIGNDAEVNKQVQEKAFELGWAWGGIDKVIKYTSADSIYFGDNNVMSYNDAGTGFFNNEPNKEITVEELLGTKSTTQTPTATTSAYKADKEVQSILIKYGGNEYTALNGEKLLDKIKEIWKEGGRSRVSIELQPQGNISSLSEPLIVFLDTIRTNKLEVQPSSLSPSEIKEYLSQDWFSNLNFDEFFNSVAVANSSSSSTQSTTANMSSNSNKLKGTKNQLLTDLSKTKIKVGADRNLSKKIQEKAFELGWGWGSEILKDVQSTGADSLFFDENKQIDAYYSEASFKEAVDFREITADELFGVQINTSNKKIVDYVILKEQRSFPNGQNIYRGSAILPLLKSIYKNSPIGNTKVEIDLVVNGKAENAPLTLTLSGVPTYSDYEINPNDITEQILYSKFKIDWFPEYQWDGLFPLIELLDFYLEDSYLPNFTTKNINELFSKLNATEVKSSNKEITLYWVGENSETHKFGAYFTDDATVYNQIDRDNFNLDVLREKLDDWFYGRLSDNYMFPDRQVKAKTPTISGSSSSVQEIKDLKEAVGVLEGIASQASQKYNTKKYEESLELLKEVKEEYSLALSFTPESSFMYERIELMKKIGEIQKEITTITELKNGGAYYILSKVVDRLERGENWKEIGNGEIMVNEVSQQEIDTVIYTEKFKNWFGDWEQALITKEYDYVSKAITESGKPCVMYHGAKRIKYSYRQVSNGVLYLAENRSYAEWFSANESPFQKQGDYLTQCFVNIKNPIDLTPFGVDEVDLRDIIQYIDALYPLAKIYDVLDPLISIEIINNNLIGLNVRAWNIIRQYPALNAHIRDNTTYDGFIYYENNPSDKIFNEQTGQLEDKVTKATAIFNSNQVKLVDAMLFDGSLDDWRFETGGKVN